MGADVRAEYPAAAGVAAFAGARGRVDARCRPLAQGSHRQPGLAELAENLSGIEAARRTENLLANSLLPQAELTFKAALAGYETGKVDFATLLDAQRQIRKARAEPAQGAGRSADAPGRNRTTVGRRTMNKGAGLTIGVIAVAVARRRRLLAGRHAAAPHMAMRHSVASAPARAGQEGAQAALLPQPDGPARHLAGAEERPDGHGLHRRSTKARTATTNRHRPTRSRSAPRRCRSSACGPKPRHCASLDKVVRAAGRVETDERRLHTISPKFEG